MRVYKVLFIDDEKELIENTMRVVEELILLKCGCRVSFDVINKSEDVENMNNMAADIVLFDCALGGAALDFGDNIEAIFGVELMRRFRKNNERTKIIFYSGGFSLSGSQCYDFTNEEMLQLINDLHIYKMIPKESQYICEAIMEALNELDSIIVSLEDLKEEYRSEGNFLVGEKLYTIDELIKELKKGSRVGEEFRKSVLKLVLTYMMKFGGDEE